MVSYPIDAVLPQLKEAVLKSPSVVVHAPPGAGKTTRIPLALLDLLPPENGRIIVLEPRRLAAVSAARWMARLLGQQAGETIGYSIRFESRVSASTRIEVVTEGILTRRMQSDPGLSGVAMVIFDEFHERSLHADLALALCLDIRRSLRPDLKIIVMSATLECGPVASLLGSAPVITTEGKIYPVEERYDTDLQDTSLPERITRAVTTALTKTSGDILVFLPGAGEIRACARALESYTGRGRGDLSIHPLYGDLPFEEQERAILPASKRKVVLATNIAETSLTIEGVRVVIDSGLTRRLHYDPAAGMNRLVTVSVSKASAEQRKGRAGRLSPGVCYRLYSRYTFQSMVPFTAPEMLISDLSALVLELAAWGVKDPSVLSWLDAPPSASWDTALQLLKELGALDPSGAITQTGKAMVRLPLHPRLARMLVRAGDLGRAYTGADLAALLSERDLLRRITPNRRAETMLNEGSEADIAERLDILHAWRKGKHMPEKTDAGAVRSVDRTAKQLVRLMPQKQKSSDHEDAGSDAISRLLLCAFPDRIARRRDDGSGRFVLVQGKGVCLPPLSSMGRSPFIIAVNVDAGDKGEGRVHLAAPLTETLIRQECAHRIETVRRIEWDKKENRIIAAAEERLGAVILSSKPFIPADEDTNPFLCDAIRHNPGLLTFGKDARQFQGRISLMRKVFPEETWPDLSDERLAFACEEWFLPWLGGIRSAQDIGNIDLLPALKARLTGKQAQLLDGRAPVAVVVPSGSRVMIDYTSGEVPVLAVKLQEMFGLADTPVIAEGRVKVLLHLLSPARRPVQITQDLKGFWNSGYQQVKKELKGRYPKHPWPDDPWNAVPTRRVK